MQSDTRRITVSREHIEAACEELARAQGSPERSMAEAAVRRALDHLNLVSRRLEEERAVAGRMKHGPAVGEAFRFTQQAWHGVSAIMQDWSAHTRLGEIRADLTRALEALDEACVVSEEERIHA
jgi:hypothetical protein